MNVFQEAMNEMIKKSNERIILSRDDKLHKDENLRENFFSEAPKFVKKITREFLEEVTIDEVIRCSKKIHVPYLSIESRYNCFEFRFRETLDVGDPNDVILDDESDSAFKRWTKKLIRYNNKFVSKLYYNHHDEGFFGYFNATRDFNQRLSIAVSVAVPSNNPYDANFLAFVKFGQFYTGLTYIFINPI